MHVEKIQGVTVLSTDDRLDGVAGPKLKELVKELAQESGMKLVIDMVNTTYVDSSGCGALVASLKAIVKNHGDMKIARPGPQTLTLLQFTRLHKVFQIYDSLESAVESCA